MRAHKGALVGHSILIVEDEPLIALEVHAAFNAAGAAICVGSFGAKFTFLMEAVLSSGTISL